MGTESERPYPFKIDWAARPEPGGERGTWGGTIDLLSDESIARGLSTEILRELRNLGYDKVFYGCTPGERGWFVASQRTIEGLITGDRVGGCIQFEVSYRDDPGLPSRICELVDLEENLDEDTVPDRVWELLEQFHHSIYEHHGPAEDLPPYPR